MDDYKAVGGLIVIAIACGMVFAAVVSVYEFLKWLL